MNDLIKTRDERTKRRKKEKKHFDRLYNLSFSDDVIALHYTAKLADKSIRLLDEGAIVGDGYVDAFIKRGVLSKYIKGENEYLPNLTDDFVGTVNLGHMDFATFPFIIGEWDKSDLSLVDIDEDRQGVNVTLHLDEDSVFVKELARQDYDIGISSEFYYHIDEEESYELGFPVIDEVYIFAYGLVGECGNVNSSGLELAMKGADMDEKMKLDIEETKDLEEEVTEETTAVESEEIENVADEEVTETETAELSADLDEDNEGEIDEEVESEEAEDGEEADDEEVDYEAALDYVHTLEESVETLKARVDELEAENAELKKTNNRISNKLKDEKTKKQAFVEQFPTIAEKLGKTSTEGVTKSYVFGDGIGE